jgi:serine/threonine protein kinase
MSNLISQNGKKSVYVEGNKLTKVFDSDFPKDEVFHEAFVNTRIENIEGLNVPKVLGITMDSEGRFGIEKEYIPGKTLLELMEENPGKIDEYIDQMVDLQMEVFKKRAPMLTRMRDKLTFQINGLNTIDAGARYELLTRLNSMPKHFKLCHGDFRPSNIIVGEDGKLYLIDWVHATQGNASGDVARTYLTLYLKDPEIAKKYYNNFCSKTKTDVEYIKKWLPIIAAANLTKNRPEEKELLESWLNFSDLM